MRPLVLLLVALFVAGCFQRAPEEGDEPTPEPGTPSPPPPTTSTPSPTAGEKPTPSPSPSTSPTPSPTPAANATPRTLAKGFDLELPSLADTSAPATGADPALDCVLIGSAGNSTLTSGSAKATWTPTLPTQPDLRLSFASPINGSRDATGPSPLMVSMGSTPLVPLPQQTHVFGFDFSKLAARVVVAPADGSAPTPTRQAVHVELALTYQGDDVVLRPDSCGG